MNSIAYVFYLFLLGNDTHQMQNNLTKMRKNKEEQTITDTSQQWK